MRPSHERLARVRLGEQRAGAGAERVDVPGDDPVAVAPGVGAQRPRGPVLRHIASWPTGVRTPPTAVGTPSEQERSRRVLAAALPAGPG